MMLEVGTAIEMTYVLGPPGGSELEPVPMWEWASW